MKSSREESHLADNRCRVTLGHPRSLLSAHVGSSVAAAGMGLLLCHLSEAKAHGLVVQSFLLAIHSGLEMWRKVS